ncbi:hypothetical protein SAMN05443637_1357 [Pseudonocardia thermophila]|jgi:hypothetical protein|uniref:Uncharacterized protein n=1 Tax=Pseudonocardia thermophila TaxID=1848 RepID=A0A1M7BD61_PSETH|nr:hypothetical protein [Pseudonocardia thermophila]SHL52942.1 hypothetical protein SAMN05443637_1357 [Pseudonocardia thermophila]
MAARKPTPRERRIALTVGLTLHPARYGHWVAKSPSGIVYVIDGTDHTWEDFRRFVAEVQGTGFRFE